MSGFRVLALLVAFAVSLGACEARTESTDPLSAVATMPLAGATPRPQYDILVTNYLGQNLTTYAENGIQTVPTIEFGQGASGLAVDATGKIYVSHPLSNTVTTYTADGKPTTPTIRGLDDPQGLTVDRQGKIYVTNSVSGTLTTYNADGTPAAPTISGLNNPGGVAVDRMGRIYIACIGTNSVTV